MAKIKPYILPIAIALGLLLHSYAPYAAPMIPYVIFTILLLNFSAVDLLRLRLNGLCAWIMLFQAGVSVGGYLAINALCANTVLAQGWLMAVLCPVASSVVVVAASIGADRRTTTGYTIYGNLLVAFVAPVVFALADTGHEVSIAEAACAIFGKVASVIALPYFVALALQRLAPRACSALSRCKEWAFPLWAFALLVTLGQTINYIFLYYKGNEATIAWLGAIASATCALQFAAGKRIGRRYGEAVAGGQMLGQKNTAIGIWMTALYLNPLASVVLAFYSIAQNLYNSWQIWQYQRRQLNH